MRDEIFQSAEPMRDFVFDSKVACVFDDMIERSVPFYHEVQRMVVELALRFIKDQGRVYDIGCSTGNTLAALAHAIEPERDVRFVGLEPSEAMREYAQEKFTGLPGPNRIKVLPTSVEQVEELPDACVVTMLYTLQFIRPVNRLKVLRMCHRSLQRGGCLILAEKILAEDSALRRFFIDFYHEFKHRSGYSEMEIARKREALENVLIPFTGSENMCLLREVGFSVVQPFFQWYSFAAYLAVKV